LNWKGFRALNSNDGEKCGSNLNFFPSLDLIYAFKENAATGIGYVL